ncbi:hypothetical protein Mpt1_c09300 [Candidatus Methanoplasma termitum]|uniref:Uncharacterized protein n=1 Tax=Candidatus Methanoplasma termitum TaxID=1577791 RepID=A0A0A7LC84_9ARCH|nr:hypothetical protein [Candidatus Methanoplasma termitum]AIZ56805.1 hypothetical protein Mpt1_c09300 [Candidatus Methanoplasma termitum]
MKRTKKVWIATIAVCLSISLFGIFERNRYVLISASVLFFMLSSYILTNNVNDDLNKNRATAAFYSVYVPGAGHFYLRQYRSGSLFLTAYVLLIGNFSLLAVFPSDSNAIAVFSSFFALLLSMFALSIIDTEYACNSLGMPYSGNPYEVKIEKYSRAYASSVLFPFAIVIAVFLGTTLLKININTDVWLVIFVLWAIALAISITWIIKRRNVTTE